MLDLNRTIKLVTGALFDRETTWQAYLAEAGDWTKTALLLTGPLIVASAVVTYLLSLVAAGGGMFRQFRPTLLATVISIVTGAIAAGVSGSSRIAPSGANALKHSQRRPTRMAKCP